MGPTDWKAKEQAIQQAMARLDFLLGSWRGEGESHGKPIQGLLRIQRMAGGGFVEQRDTQVENQSVVHDDLAIYRWDDANQTLRVQHYAPPGVVVDAYVLFEAERGGIRWVAGPGAARVEIWPDGDRLCLAVFLPGESEPAQQMTYQRVESE